MDLKNNNHIPLDKFINDSLYNPKKGFYMKKNPFGKDGDFITSPNISVLFSEMMALWAVAFWQNLKNPKKINLIELGGGNGEMLNQMISSFQKFPNFYKSCNFYLYEISPFLKKIQKNKLKKFNVKWLNNFNQINKYPSIFLANEFFDALPIKQFIKLNNIWHERYIDLTDKKKPNFINKIINIKNLNSKLGMNYHFKQDFIEYSPLGVRLIKKISKLIYKNNGGLLILDYGNFETKMFNTLKTIKKHKYENFFYKIGESDISYDLNFLFIKKLLKNLNLRIAGSTTQRNFLLNLGILSRAEIVSKNMVFSKKADLFYRLQKLIGERQMGNIFKVFLATSKKTNFNLGFE